MQGVLSGMNRHGVPMDVIEEIKNALDCSLYFFGHRVEISSMYLILGVTVAILIGVYILINFMRKGIRE